jgi:hypothetical protein
MRWSASGYDLHHMPTGAHATAGEPAECPGIGQGLFQCAQPDETTVLI